MEQPPWQAYVFPNSCSPCYRWLFLLSSCSVQESKLRAENGRLQLELEAVRADRERLLSSQQATTSGQTAPGWQPPALPQPKPQRQPQVRSITDGQQHDFANNKRQSAVSPLCILPLPFCTSI